MANISHFTQTVNGVSTTYDIRDANAVPRRGGAVMVGEFLGKSPAAGGSLMISGGNSRDRGGDIILMGITSDYNPGGVAILPQVGDGREMTMWFKPDGTWTWTGQAVQLLSDQRLKQQIAEIDDKLLDAWEDVNLVQFKYNDAVKEKSDNARLHTGYVVQQIDKACKSHGVDISAYGLYCHEEYAEETREVEQADGTKKTEIVRPANEHYSLRYTEVYAVECMYLRRCIAKLTARIEQLEKGKEQEASK